jgi:hypothetical protein
LKFGSFHSFAFIFLGVFHCFDRLKCDKALQLYNSDIKN